ncbi:MAG: iron ABC transporter permease, partial [Treponema sp.]|nr:iron ABC transporter permease [Treponema sp.]
MISEKQFKIFAPLLIILPLVTAVCCLGFGRFALSPRESLSVLVQGFMGRTVSPMAYSVVFKVRLPRIILSMFVGSGLACSGAAFQSLFTNPLATPDTLGVASAASFGASLAMLFHVNLIFIQISALAFGLLACWITYNLGRIKDKSSIVMIVLSGMVISALFQAFVSLVKYVADPEDDLPSITYWLMGSMTSASYKTIALGAPFILLGIAIIFVLRWRLNVLSLNEDESRSMGINLKAMQLTIIVSSSLITASAVSM